MRSHLFRSCHARQLSWYGYLLSQYASCSGTFSDAAGTNECPGKCVNAKSGADAAGSAATGFDAAAATTGPAADAAGKSAELPESATRTAATGCPAISTAETYL